MSNELFPAVLKFPAIHALVEEKRRIDENTGELAKHNQIKSIGTLSFKTHDLPENLVNTLVQLEYNQRRNEKETTTTPVTTFIRTLATQPPLTDTVTTIENTTLTLELTQSHVHETATEFGERGHKLFDTLLREDAFPLEQVGTTNKNNEAKYELTIDSHLLMPGDYENTFDNAWYNAIEDYQRGVFVNKPTMALVFALSKQYDQAVIARMCEIDASTVSRHISDAEALLTRATHTHQKYTAE